MSRTGVAPHRPRTTRLAVPLVLSATLVSTVAGCAAAADSETEADSETVIDASYRDGSYKADGAYESPAGDESIIVIMQLENDIVADVEIGLYPTSATSSTYQDLFAGGIAEAVIGRDIDTLNVTTVAGSSLTSIGFRAALETIKAEAREE